MEEAPNLSCRLSVYERPRKQSASTEAAQLDVSLLSPNTIALDFQRVKITGMFNQVSEQFPFVNNMKLMYPLS